MARTEVVIISGLSGSGKSTALKAFEDLGYFCVDNLPPELLESLLRLRSGERVAVVIDVRAGEIPFRLALLKELSRKGYHYEILFLTATPEVLLYRYSQTRRPHPLGKDLPLREALSQEAELLAPLREMATVILDTSHYNLYQLREEILRRYGQREELSFPTIHLLSFGYKYGLPAEAHFLFDLRFLPNPYFVPELKPLSGKDPRIKEYVLKSPEAQRFLEALTGLFRWLIPYYEKEGRAYVVVALGCTGGRHRSVAVTEALAEALRPLGRKVLVTHRDLEKDGP
ncbi:RNase adapter RapZ [Thermosulfurimonas marina]|uniref:RNase adapter RapZ n=1 Tax=Thermosulfurimonas marina TaxID=2047767 RepID=A0A6H1WUS7_9BACT|nr:RNase adapter RapZ [Thermosulfurimonas marina]QJA06940.1 RNase adapter RapZ [Thermosulfurimonas marina]